MQSREFQSFISLHPTPNSADSSPQVVHMVLKTLFLNMTKSNTCHNQMKYNYILNYYI